MTSFWKKGRRGAGNHTGDVAGRGVSDSQLVNSVSPHVPGSIHKTGRRFL